MSTAKTREQGVETCQYCGDEFETGYNEEYCSQECYNLQKGEDLLRNIKYDHRWCHGCWRRLKEVEKPRASDPEFVVGFQHLTRHARKGEREDRGYVDDISSDTSHHGSTASRFSLADSLIVTGTICECGSTDTSDEYLRDERLVDVCDAATRLVEILEWMGHEGQHDKTIQAKILVETLTETVRESGEPDWALAVGRAVA